MIQVTEYLWRSARPTLAEVIDNKFEVVIDLESGVYEMFHDDDLEKAELEQEWKFHSFPLSDIFPPSAREINDILGDIEDSEFYKRKTLIHCLSGVDRTGFVCAAYKMRFMKWSFKDAEAEWIKLGRHWHYFWWSWFLKKYER